MAKKHDKCQETIDGLNVQIADLQSQIQNLNSQINTLKTQNVSAASAGNSASNSDSNDTTSAAENTSNNATAWLSATGSKYHSIPDCGNMNPNNARQTTVSQAQAMGYGACSKCW